MVWIVRASYSKSSHQSSQQWYRSHYTAQEKTTNCAQPVTFHRKVYCLLLLMNVCACAFACRQNIIEYLQCKDVKISIPKFTRNNRILITNGKQRSIALHASRVPRLFQIVWTVHGSYGGTLVVAFSMELRNGYPLPKAASWPLRDRSYKLCSHAIPSRTLRTRDNTIQTWHSHRARRCRSKL